MKSNLEILIDIDKKVCTLSPIDRSDILEILKYHEAEPMAAAERISELLEVSYQSIFDLL